MTDERTPTGTKDDPITVTQYGYRRCGHAVRSPAMEKGKYYVVEAYLDVGGFCPNCRAATVAR